MARLRRAGPSGPGRARAVGADRPGELCWPGAGRRAAGGWGGWGLRITGSSKPRHQRMVPHRRARKRPPRPGRVSGPGRL